MRLSLDDSPDPALRLDRSLSEIGPHDHVCLIFDSEEEQHRTHAAFVRHGLAAGDRCLCVAGGGGDAAGLAAALRRGGVDVEGAASRAALELATERTTYLAGGEFDPEAMCAALARLSEQATRSGFRALRVAGEVTWALGDALETERVLDYEARVNALLPDVPCLALCQYDRRRFPPAVLRDVIRTHPLALVQGRLCRNFYYVPPGELIGPDRLARDVDRLLENVLEREQSEEALRASERRAELSSRLASMGTLAAGVAHEINNPLTYVDANLRWALERLERDGSTPRSELRAALAEALEGAVRVRDIVLGLRRLAEPRAGGPRATGDVAAEIRAALGIVRRQVESRARLALDLAPDLPVVPVPPPELAQLVVNLVANAAQAIRGGSPGAHEVRIQARREAGGLALEVQDTGDGISPEDLPRIFDPFFTTRRSGVGAGLGLAICHRIVQAAGGTIAVESAPGRGSTFRIRLPAPEAGEDPG
ncbi:MEDS domain-containing protein [Anaeromyxobacter paludicola]|uniref:histidine kinase n=1 Tax=Anaeromyxobacter paludicola TaxID=2918171 RepID=A0ABM7XAF9_9BACT|nr:MEDS domain-containing protein [Anaeromyxobacter paludicola]BDG08837.1 hypothetical protein AMPC_19500 [Anaeromyxobacter paludicola]